MTNRESHEEAAGMGLEPAFFTSNGIDPDAEAKDTARKRQAEKLWELLATAPETEVAA